ncbi:MAG: hypothetical protein EBQ97_05285, partial [Bacteroidetes bacterium]|nr:hypothetical protein [Bacteroidota bacterium]
MKNNSVQAIVDCNSFYCACERLFQPQLQHAPVVVLSNNDGCIVSRSDEAKQLGINMAIPYFQAKELIEKNKVHAFSSNYHLYGDLSWRVMETMRQLAPPGCVEVYSVDEAFINLDHIASDQLQDFSAGTCQIVLNNNDRRFDPVNTSSPYINPSTGKSGVTPRRKVTVKHGSTALFTGRITDIDLEYMPNPSTQSKVKVDASDDFILLASTNIASFTPPSELSGARVTRILDLAEVNFPATARSIAAGTATLAANVIADNTTALTYLMKITATEQGYMYIKGDGTLVFTNKQTPAFSPSVFTFADDGTGTKYSALTIQYGQELLYNKVTCQTETGLPQTVNDTSSQAD